MKTVNWERMFLTHAQDSDLPAIVELANLAYRASGPAAGWNCEEGILEGERLTLDLLRADLTAKPHAHLLVWREKEELLGTAWLEPQTENRWYLGLLMVRPAMQNRHLGRTLLAAAEDFARAHNGIILRMTVIHVRETLVAWYRRRGYTLTGETEPFPYGDDRFGKPLRDDLYFVVLEKAL